MQKDEKIKKENEINQKTKRKKYGERGKREYQKKRDISRETESEIKERNGQGGKN